jgi:DNA (cytosine-5)-methyltransferase 1
MREPTMVDLFSGAGGISHGFQQAGFRVIGGVDFDRDSVATFVRNHPGSKGICADLSKLSGEGLAEALGVKPGTVDCVAGGPPCQGFSRNRAFRHKDGSFVDDARNHLYWHFFEFIEHLRPKVVVMENVPEILIKADGYFRDAVFARFKKLGYKVSAKVLNAADYGVPQRRKRAIFLASCDGGQMEFPTPSAIPGRRPGRRTPTSNESSEPRENTLFLFEDRGSGPTVWDAISDLHGKYADSIDGDSAYASEALTEYQRKRRGTSDRVWNHYPWRLSEKQVERIKLLREGQGHLHLPAALRPKEGYGSAYRRMQSDAQALTITTWMFHPGSGMFTHPFDNRVITIREAARLQSFQDDFVFSGRYHSQCRQVGNSVAPLLARQLAEVVSQYVGNAVQESFTALAIR